MKKIFFFISTFLTLSSVIYCQTDKTYQCKIWHTQDLSKYPDSINIPYKIRATNCTWTTKPGNEFKTDDFIAVRLTFISSSDTVFELKSKFRNIYLGSKMNIIHPYALLWYSLKYDSSTKKEISVVEYMTRKFRAKEYYVSIKTNTKYDLIFLFPSKYFAEGYNVLIIENFIRANLTK